MEDLHVLISYVSYINWSPRKKDECIYDFQAYVALWCLIQMAQRLQWRYFPCSWRHRSNSNTINKYSKKIFVQFHRLYKNCFNSQMHIPIWLKFGTLTENMDSNNSIKFGINPLNNSRNSKWVYVCNRSWPDPWKDPWKHNIIAQAKNFSIKYWIQWVNNLLKIIGNCIITLF